MSLFTTVLAFLLALGPLIIFHELGHYWVARLCGVKVLRFSLGMGKVVWSRRFGPDQTEWAISALPLGGYVKMLDNRDPDTAAKTEAEAQREFTRQSVWRRIAIVAAGPIANFVLAIVVFSGLYIYGIDEAATRVRAMPETSAAWQAGLRGGERIVGINGEALASWSELRWEILQAAIDKREVRLEVAGDGGGRFAAILPQAAMAGLDIDGDVMGALGLAVARPPPVIKEIVPGGGAAEGGLRVGDLVLTVDGKPVSDGIAFIDAVRAAGARTLQMTVDRAGQQHVLDIKPQFDSEHKTWRIKAAPDVAPEMVNVASSPVAALAKAVRTTWDTSAMTVKMIGKMIVGQVSWKNVTGPITIADYAGQTARAGPIEFLRFIAFISISLGVMNLLPIPVLDGGLLLYYSLEVLTGRPLPERIGMYFQLAGVGMLIMLMTLAVFNDIARQHL